jgi:molecular chaperone GrpE
MKDEENKDNLKNETSGKGEGRSCCSGEKPGKDAAEESKNAGDSQEIYAKMQAVESENRNLKDTLLRKMAEFDNLRKRLEKERDEAIKYANFKFAKDLLVVCDNFDRVMKNSDMIDENLKNDEKLKAFFEGVKLCDKELLSVFGKHGIARIEVKGGGIFDPQYHQAVCEVDAAGVSPGAVAEVFQAGYMYRDRLLRPSTVSVARKQ